jgi:hypothetical protein
LAAAEKNEHLRRKLLHLLRKLQQLRRKLLLTLLLLLLLLLLQAECLRFTRRQLAASARQVRLRPACGMAIFCQADRVVHVCARQTCAIIAWRLQVLHANAAHWPVVSLWCCSLWRRGICRCRLWRCNYIRLGSCRCNCSWWLWRCIIPWRCSLWRCS